MVFPHESLGNRGNGQVMTATALICQIARSLSGKSQNLIFTLFSQENNLSKK